MAGQVGDEDAVASRERRCERSPVLDRPAQPVHEDERRTVTADHVAQPRAAPPELALLEARETLFALRRHKGIFFGGWMFL